MEPNLRTGQCVGVDWQAGEEFGHDLPQSRSINRGCATMGAGWLGERTEEACHVLFTLSIVAS